LGSLHGLFGSRDGLIVALLDEPNDVVARSMLADIEAATTTTGERPAALWRNISRPPVEALDWLHFKHEVWA